MRVYNDELCHWGIKGMKWGVRRYQNKDGTLTPLGRKHYTGPEDSNSEKEKIDYAPPRKGKDASEYTDEELQARIKRMQMEDQYRTLMGKTDIRADDPNKELKAEKERLQLQKDVMQLRKDVYEGKSFVGDIIKDSSKQVLTKVSAGVMSYGVKNFMNAVFKNPDLANAMVSGSAEKNKKDDKSS